MRKLLTLLLIGAVIGVAVMASRRTVAQEQEPPKYRLESEVFWHTSDEAMWAADQADGVVDSPFAPTPAVGDTNHAIAEVRLYWLRCDGNVCNIVKRATGYQSIDLYYNRMRSRSRTGSQAGLFGVALSSWCRMASEVPPGYYCYSPKGIPALPNIWRSKYINYIQKPHPARLHLLFRATYALAPHSRIVSSPLIHCNAAAQSCLFDGDGDGRWR